MESLQWIDSIAIERYQVYPITPRQAMQGQTAGQHRSIHRGTSVEFAEYRKYEHGDDPRRIDWRLLGRTNRYFVKEFEADTTLRSFLYIDCSRSMLMPLGSPQQEGRPSAETRHTFAKKFVATLGFLLLKQNDSVALSFNDGSSCLHSGARQGQAGLQGILGPLNSMDCHASQNLADDLHHLADALPARSLVVVASDLLCDPEALNNSLEHLRHRQHEVILFHLILRAEQQLSLEQPTRFVDLESGRTVDCEPGGVEQHYDKALREHLNQLKEITSRSRVRYHQLRCEDGVSAAIGSMFGEQALEPSMR